MQVLVDKFDDFGQGITFVDDVITFVPNTIPGDIVDIKIVKKKKKYNVGKVINYIKLSKDRIDYKCPYFNKCGGCVLQSISYDATINFKLNKVINLFNKYNLDIKPEIVKNPSDYNYRNKIKLMVIDGKIGYFETNSHTLVEINECIIASKAINKIIPLLKNFNIINGNIVIRCNLNDEILIIIESNDKLNIDIDVLKENIKLVGIVVNNKTIYGDNFLIECINDIYYKISYDSFFQINPYVASKLFNIVKENIDKTDIVLDLYCGVGTLSLNAALNANEVIGVEIVPNAVLNAIYNAKINKINNTKFILNDAQDAVGKINKKFDKIIIDPPRSGLTKKTIDTILTIMPKKIIYVSCDPNTLIRDILLLKDKYSIEKSYILDMFSYSYHVECICILNLF